LRTEAKLRLHRIIIPERNFRNTMLYRVPAIKIPGLTWCDEKYE
jgi:hypothetical protein